MDSPSAGWYPDPHDGGAQRWWDGQCWTRAVRPVAGAQAPGPPQPAVWSQQGSSGGLPGVPWSVLAAGLLFAAVVGGAVGWFVSGLGDDPVDPVASPRPGSDEVAGGGEGSVAAQAARAAGVPISAGDGHTCGLGADGTPVCWGDDRHGIASPPEGVRLTAVSAGAVQTCGLTLDGTPVCWGDGADGQTSPPAGLRLQAISAGKAHTCGLVADGTPVCWGSDEQGQASPPEGLTLTALSVGEAHTCGVEVDGAPVCWGSDEHGQASPLAGLRLGARPGGR